MAKYNTLPDLFTNIANSIRNKTGTTNRIPASDFPQMIKDMQSYAPNGTRWTYERTSVGGVVSIYWYDGLWVLGSSSKGIFYSNTGKNWIQSNITTGFISSVFNIDGTWWACTNQNGLCYSSDGKIWTQLDAFRNDIYGEHLFKYNNLLIIGIRQGSPYGIFYSSDNQTWICASGFDGQVMSMYAANGIIVAASFQSGLYYSIDGKNWTQSNITSIGRSVYYANGIWVASSDNHGFYYSEDGITWFQSNISEARQSLIHNANGIWVAGGYDGFYYSTDGKIWTQSNITTAGDIRQISNANGIWIAVPFQNNIYYSIDGKTWEQTNREGAFTCVHNADGLWLAGSTDYGLFSSVSWEPSAELIQGGLS